eukprot:gene10417-4949_t
MLGALRGLHAGRSRDRGGVVRSAVAPREREPRGEDSAGAGDYTLDYNYAASWWGTYSSNHVELAAPQYEPLLDYAPAARRAAERYGCAGLHSPPHIAPWGHAATLGPSPWGDLSLHWSGVLSAVNFIAHWEYTRDVSFLRTRALPFCRDVLAFYQ